MWCSWMMDMPRIDAELKDELESLIKCGVDRAFKDVGLNQSEVFELRKDMTFLREWRISCEDLRHKGLWYSISLIVLGLTALIAMGFKQWLAH